jgi:hypothetical protein
MWEKCHSDIAISLTAEDMLIEISISVNRGREKNVLSK